MSRGERSRGMAWAHISFILFIHAVFRTCMSQLPPSGPIRIDCGNTADTRFTDEQGLDWFGDLGYQNGTPVTISGEGLSKVETTMRMFPRGDPCYRVVVPNGRFLVRASFAYHPAVSSWDTPLMGIVLNKVSVQVISVDSRYTFYTSFSLSVTDQLVEFCLRELEMTPFISSLEILPQDSRSYLLDDAADGSILSMHVRMNVGGLPIAEHQDPGFRLWDSDESVYSPALTRVVTTENVITIDAPYNTYRLPQKMFQSARASSAGDLNFTHGNLLQEDGRNVFMAILYFVELEETVKRGDRVFHIFMNGALCRGGFDILAATRDVHFSGVMVHCTKALLAGGVIDVRLRPVAGTTKLQPVLSGIELFEVIKFRPDPPLNPDSPLRIDCGGPVSFTNEVGTFWRPDTGYHSGYVSTVPNSQRLPKNFMNNTLRYFPDGYKNCYVVNLPSVGRYIVRLSLLYNNYDDYNTPPKFSVSVQREFVFNITVPLNGSVPRGQLDVLAYMTTGVGEVCFYPEDKSTGDETDPFVNGLEFLPIDLNAYTDFPELKDTSKMLVNIARINCGGPIFGDGIDNVSAEGSVPKDKAYRAWLDGKSSLVITAAQIVLSVNETSIDPNSTVAPNYFPQMMYSTAQSVNGSLLQYSLNVTDWVEGDTCIFYFHFAELNETITPGQRQFDILINGQIFETAVDVVARAGGAKKGIYIAKQIQPGPNINIELRTASATAYPVGPILNGLEIYRIEDIDKATDPADVTALLQMKEELKVTDESGWQGDPCAPYPWDGLNCSPDTDELPWKIVAIEAWNFSLNGSITPTIARLNLLESINMTRNHLSGAIPNEIGNLAQLNSLDLSYNDLSGPIPASVLALLTQRPGFTLNLAGNPNLCGGAGYRSCSSKSSNSALALGIVAAIIGSVILVAILAAGCIVMRRRRAFSFHRMDRMDQAVLSDSDILKGPDTEGAGIDYMSQQRKMKLPPRVTSLGRSEQQRTNPMSRPDRSAGNSERYNGRRDVPVGGMDVELRDTRPEARNGSRQRQQHTNDDVVYVGFDGQ